MDKNKMTQHIKVNLPLTEGDYVGGNGEGVWVLVDEKTKMDYDSDAAGTGYVGILDNDSLYYPGLKAGAVIPFEMRGIFRPVADYPDYLSQFSKLTPGGKKLLIQKILESKE